MADYATKNEVQEIVNKAVDDLSAIIQSFAQNVDERFNIVDERFNGMDERFNKVDAEIAELNRKNDHVIRTLEAYLKKPLHRYNHVGL